MKFGNRLKKEILSFDPLFIQSFVKYKLRKKGIKECMLTPTDANKRKWLETVEGDIARVCKCYDSKLLEIRKAIDDFINRLRELDGSKISFLKRKLLKSEIKSAYGHLQLLKYFSRLNYTGLRKILKKFDKNLKVTMGEDLMKMALETTFVDLSTLETVGDHLQDLYYDTCVGVSKTEVASELKSVDPGLENLTKSLLNDTEMGGKHLLSPDDCLESAKNSNKGKPGQVLLAETAYEERHLR